MTWHSIGNARPYSNSLRLVGAVPSDVSAVLVESPPPSRLRLLQGEPSSSFGPVDEQSTVVAVANRQAESSDVALRLVTPEGTFDLFSLGGPGPNSLIVPYFTVLMSDDEHIDIVLKGTSAPGAAINAFASAADLPRDPLKRPRTVVDTTEYVTVLPGPSVDSLVHVPLGNQGAQIAGIATAAGGPSETRFRLLKASGESLEISDVFQVAGVYDRLSNVLLGVKLYKGDAIQAKLLTPGRKVVTFMPYIEMQKPNL
jgi:hypothetical protein